MSTGRRPRRECEFVCIDSIRDELEGDDETLADLRERVEELAAELPGFGVALHPDDQPDRILWYPPGAPAISMRYDSDAFVDRTPFAEWVRGLFR